MLQRNFFRTTSGKTNWNNPTESKENYQAWRSCKEANSSPLQLQLAREQESAPKIAVEELQARGETKKQNLTKAIQQLERKVAAVEQASLHQGERSRHIPLGRT